MTLKAYHMPKHCRGLYNTVRQNFTTQESYGGIHLIYGHDFLKVNRRINAKYSTRNVGLHVQDDIQYGQ